LKEWNFRFEFEGKYKLNLENDTALKKSIDRIQWMRKQTINFEYHFSNHKKSFWFEINWIKELNLIICE
jgi:hypothetical protein